MSVGNAKHRSNVSSGVVFDGHPVRAALPWRMPEAQDDVSR
ncbi:MAG TPA: hypothetical protein VGE64_10350 [Xanthomonadaceae bacterium]